MFIWLSDLIGHKVSQFLNSKSTGAYVCGKGVGDGGESIFFQHRKSNCKATYLFLMSLVNFPFLDGDVPRSASYGVYMSQLIRFARVSSHVDDFNTRNKVLTAKLLRQGYRYHKLRKAFSKFYRRHFDIVSKYNVGLKTLLLQGLSEPEFYSDLVYKFRKIIGKNDFPYHFK